MVEFEVEHIIRTSRDLWIDAIIVVLVPIVFVFGLLFFIKWIT